MYCRNFLLVMSFVLLTASSVPAEEGASEADTVDQGNYSGKQDQSWELIQTKLGGMKTKLDTQSGLLTSLLAEKENLTNKDELARKNEELKTQHAKYEKLIEEYNKLNEEYLTKFPERGLKEKRIYQRVKTKTLDSFEDDFTLRGRLNKLHNKVLKQYPKAIRAEAKKNKNPDGVSLGGLEAPVSATDVTAPIELKK